MAAIQKVADWLRQRYPKPNVDLEWLQGCYAWVAEDQGKDPVNDFDGFIGEVDSQFLQSDLNDSVQPNTGLNHNVGTFTGTLQGPPILVQITAITEIAHSAFQLEQVRVAREERMRTHTGDEEGEEEGDIEIEGEGPMPKYPRGMLRFQLSDGVVTLNAIEYRPISQLSLGNTPLGYKLQLAQTRIRNGIALLEPATIKLLGGECADMENAQREDLRLGLRIRRGLPLDNAAPIDPNQASATSRLPLGDIPVPPQPPPQTRPRDADVERERPRRVPTVQQPPPQAPPPTDAGTRRIVPLKKSTDVRVSETTAAAVPTHRPAAERATLAHATAETTSPYFGKSSLVDDGVLEFSFRPTVAQVTRTIPESSRSAGKQPMRSLPSPSPPPAHPLFEDGSSDYGGNDDFDVGMLEDIDRIEREALANQSKSSPKGPSSASQPARIQEPDVIEIDGSGDEKENQPVYSRNVRRRVVESDMVLDLDDDDSDNPFLDENSRSPARTRAELHPEPFPLSQRRGGRPVILAQRSEDIIDLT